MKGRWGESFRCTFQECAEVTCLHEDQRYELTGRLSDDGRGLTEVKLQGLVQ